MPTRLAFSALSLAALTALATAQSPVTQPRGVDDLLPASTYTTMRFGGLEACRTATGQQSVSALIEAFLGQLPRELRQQHLDHNLDLAAEQVRQALQEVGLRPDDVRALLGQPMAIGIGRLSVEGMGPSVALLIEEGNQAAAIGRCCQALLRALPRMGVDVEIGAAEVAGISMQHVQIQGGPPLFAGSIGGSFCLSNSRGYLREIARVAASQQPGLVQATRLSGLRQQLPAPPLLAWTVNMTSVMDALAPHLPYEADDFADALGLGRFDMLYAATTADAHGGTDLLHIGIGGSEHGLAKALVAAPVDLSFAKACSANTVVFGAGSFDVPAVIDAFRHFTKLLPAEARREIERELQREFSREFRQMGTSPGEVHGMLAAFGNQVGFAIGLEKGALPKPELLVRLAVRETEPVASLMQRIEALSAREAHVEWRSRKAGDHQVRFCNVPIEDSLQLSPCYLIADGGLWIGSDVLGLVRALGRADSPEDSLVAEPDFQAMQKAAAGQSGVLHVRSFRGIEIGWRSVETMLYPMLDARSEQLGFDSEALPDSESLAAAMGTTTYLYRVDADGITVKSDGTFVFGALLAAFGSLGDTVLDRASAKVY